MKRISIRYRGGTSYLFGPGKGPTILVRATSRREALHKAKAEAKAKGLIEEMARNTGRADQDFNGRKTDKKL